MNAEEIINHFQMEKHPEGGYYKETYRCFDKIETMNGERAISTAIYFLLHEGEKSHFHKIKSDEFWHHYMGGPLRLLEITPEGQFSETIIGKDLEAGQVPQYCVNAGNWFAATPCDGSDFTLCGCTVAPGFDFEDFKLAKKKDLLLRYPQLEDLIGDFSLN
ncbi:MAG: cupin domain-containing protein [Deltaproteobacteria bacterium]|jgi:uncharacterized protein|nr:MAG: cupin domain-containing protein [Deltaproteobacteria bacterium]